MWPWSRHAHAAATSKARAFEAWIGGSNQGARACLSVSRSLASLPAITQTRAATQCMLPASMTHGARRLTAAPSACPGVCGGLHQAPPQPAGLLPPGCVPHDCMPAQDGLCNCAGTCTGSMLAPLPVCTAQGTHPGGRAAVAGEAAGSKAVKAADQAAQGAQPSSRCMPQARAARPRQQ